MYELMNGLRICVEDKWSHIKWSISGLSVLFHVCFMLVTHCFVYGSFEVNFGIRKNQDNRICSLSNGFS